MCCNFSCLSGDDGSTCIPITSNNVEIVASQDSSINSKARGSNKVRSQIISNKIALPIKFIYQKDRNVETYNTNLVLHFQWPGS